MREPTGRLAWVATRRVAGALDATLWLLVRTLRALAIGAVAFVACVTIVLSAAAWEVSRFLPEDPIALMDGRERGSVAVYDRYGALVGVRGQRFQRLTLADAGPILVDAVLATEDRRFYWHLGLDPVGLIRAMWVNYRAGRTEQGGSSITQQVAKLAFLTSERRIERKLREVPLALALEWRYSKGDILAIYLNRAYLGGGAYGFAAATDFYFGRKPSELSHAQAALLAGLLRAPSRWSPTNDFEAAQSRARVILDAMLDAEKLDVGQHAVAHAEVARITPPRVDETAPHFVDWIADRVPERFWDLAADLEIHTTLDPREQIVAEKAIATAFLGDLGPDASAEAAMVILGADGALRAMVGGRDYASSQFNRAASSRRQLGSAFKPIVYAAALEQGFSPDSTVNDAPVTIDGWSPKNYSRSYRGRITLRAALARSSNVASVRTAHRIGIGKVVDMARRLGFAGDIPAFPSLALGTLETNPLEVASAYATFARDGVATPAYAVTRIRNRRGEDLWSREEPPSRLAISPRVAADLNSMMLSVVEAGTGRRARLDGVEVVGKTGTTQEYRDAWFAASTPDRTAVVWMGHDDFAKMDNITGGSWPAHIWVTALAELHGVQPASEAPSRARDFGDGESDPTRPRPVPGAAVASIDPVAPRTPSLLRLPRAGGDDTAASQRRASQSPVLGGLFNERVTPAPGESQSAREERRRKFFEQIGRGRD